jgi:hypothetical protein
MNLRWGGEGLADRHFWMMIGAEDGAQPATLAFDAMRLPQKW